MQKKSFALSRPFTARDPYTGKPVEVIGVDDTTQPHQWLAQATETDGEIVILHLGTVKPDDTAAEESA